MWTMGQTVWSGGGEVSTGFQLDDDTLHQQVRLFRFPPLLSASPRLRVSSSRCPKAADGRPPLLWESGRARSRERWSWFDGNQALKGGEVSTGISALRRRTFHEEVGALPSPSLRPASPREFFTSPKRYGRPLSGESSRGARSRGGGEGTVVDDAEDGSDLSGVDGGEVFHRDFSLRRHLHQQVGGLPLLPFYPRLASPREFFTLSCRRWLPLSVGKVHAEAREREGEKAMLLLTMRKIGQTCLEWTGRGFSPRFQFDDDATLHQQVGVSSPLLPFYPRLPRLRVSSSRCPKAADGHAADCAINL